MTNDAERVSDIVARLRTPASKRPQSKPTVADLEALMQKASGAVEISPSGSISPTEDELAAADIIEAQSKALAEARELVAAGNNLLDCANAIVGASMGDPDADEAFDMFDAARGKWRLHARDTLSALVTPTPENPNG